MMALKRSTKELEAMYQSFIVWAKQTLGLDMPPAMAQLTKAYDREKHYMWLAFKARLDRTSKKKAKKSKKRKTKTKKVVYTLDIPKKLVNLLIVLANKEDTKDE